ncbi:hypothetical protein [Mesorhizobium sp. CAU 1732]|uniref:hypothetical protein n=1 Tax=Mesorhizobium sp. CAU 1732 TaxID=3140358 RepID=UPI003260FF42
MRNDSRQAGTENGIEITPEMIAAGTLELRDMRFGRRMADILEAIYLAMEIEKRAQLKSDAF